MRLTSAGPDTQPNYDDTFTVDGVACRWYRGACFGLHRGGPRVRVGRSSAAPVDSGYQPSWSTPKRIELSERRKRESGSLARHARRVREQTATMERA